MKSQQLSDADYKAAVSAGRARASTEIVAQGVRYIPERDVIEIVMESEAGVVIPRAWIEALNDVPMKELSKLVVWPDGSAIELEDRDIHISVHGLMTTILPSLLPARFVTTLFGQRGGQATSEAKRESARINGSKGGRPRKAIEFTDKHQRTIVMKEPGLDNRHRDKTPPKVGEIQQKRGDTLNKNLPRPIPEFRADTTLKTMRDKTGKVSVAAVTRAAKRLGR